MTLFTKLDCRLCEQLKKKFDLAAMQVKVEILDNNDAGALAHLAWHGLVDYGPQDPAAAGPGRLLDGGRLRNHRATPDGHSRPAGPPLPGRRPSLPRSAKTAAAP